MKGCLANSGQKGGWGYGGGLQAGKDQGVGPPLSRAAATPCLTTLETANQMLRFKNNDEGPGLGKAADGVL